MKDIYLYHYGTRGYEDVRPRAFIDTEDNETIKELLGEVRYETYQYEVSGFMGLLTKDSITKLIQHGFKNWDIEDLVCYKVNITDQLDKINYINYSSLPEHNTWLDKHWDNLYSDYLKHCTLNESVCYTIKDMIFNKMIVDTGIPRYTYPEYHIELLSKHKDWLDPNKFVDKNIKDGRVEQYASYIPHTLISVKEPLTIEEVIELV